MIRAGGTKRRLTKETREKILQLFVDGKEVEAQAIATSHGLAQDYVWKLAHARGLVMLSSRPAPRPALNLPTSCPCCGQSIPEGADIRWDNDARTLSGKGMIAVLTPKEGTVFNALWRAWPSGRLLDTNQLMDLTYAD